MPEPRYNTESGGILLYRFTPELKVLIAHPGGPFWAKRQEGAWSIPKGLLEAGEDPLQAAAREFAEETGKTIDLREAITLGSVKLKSGKTVHAWAVPGDIDPAGVVSNTFEIEWPPRSGRRESFPEIDRVLWVERDEAAMLLNEALVAFVDRLIEYLSNGPSLD